MTKRMSAALTLFGAMAAVAVLVFLPAGRALWTEAALTVFQRQQELHQLLASDLRAVHDAGPIAAMGLIGLSFVYGVLHALGPGHGKAVVSAYVVADARRLRQGVAMAWLASGLQALVAITLVTIILLVSTAALRQTQLSTLILERVGYGLVVLIGILMGGMAVWRGIRGAHEHHCQDHHSEFGHVRRADLSLREGPGGSRLRQALLVFAVGVRPCSGAVLVLGFAKVVGVFLYGILATIAMSIGTALTVSALAVMTFFFRRSALNLVGERASAVGALELGLALLAAVGLILLGSLLLAGSFTTSLSPFRI